MGIAVPSLAEASRRLPSSVKADQATADDVPVTSVANAPPAAIDEPVSPELALVDPVLRERLRGLLPEIELELPPPLLRAVPDPGLEDQPPLAPPPVLVEPPQAVASRLATVREIPVYVQPSRGERFSSFAKAFALGAAVAAVVTVGVVAELGEGPVTPQEPVTTPPRGAAPAPAPKTGSGGGATDTSSKPAADGSDNGRAAVKKQARSAARKKTQRQATKTAASGPSGPAVSRTAQPKTKQTAKKSAATAAASPEPRRFAWAPVDGAVSYRLELFRGDKQVLEARTKAPAYELESQWRHAGKTESLTPGGYRWYVWPVFSSGPAAQAVVQARLTVP